MRDYIFACLNANSLHLVLKPHPCINTVPFLRRVHHLLAAFLPDTRAEGPLPELLYHSLTVQRCHLAGLSQQRCQPRHLHHFQHWISQGLHQNPALLREMREHQGECQGGNTLWFIIKVISRKGSKNDNCFATLENGWYNGYARLCSQSSQSSCG